MATRLYSLADKVCLGVDQAVRALCNNAETTHRPYPAQNQAHTPLSESQAKHSAALMRINHAGEICAQALYHGQGLASQDLRIQSKMRHAAIEEGDHLAWCKLRLDELGSHTSYLNPLWYAGSFAIGLSAGLVGDRWSLGFLAETEDQVVAHLNKHLQALSGVDQRSYQILQQMQVDEAKHHAEAIDAGGYRLPAPIKKLMSLISKIMVKTAYWL